MSRHFAAFSVATAFASYLIASTARAEDVKLGGREGTARPSCVEVEIDGEKSPPMTCLNQELEQKAAAVPRIPNIAPVDATSSGVRTGGFNQAAVSQQYGQNFGKSTEPYRPPAPVYAPPLGGH